LVYKRSCKEQTITVIINVNDEKATVENINGKVIYTVGGDAKVENGKCEVKPCSAVFVEE
ncbi:MAG: glycosylase, partial [Acutalibacteraceae bacterium]